MFTWLKKLFKRQPALVWNPNDLSRVASSHIVINKDGTKEEFLYGTVCYAKGCEPVGGHKPITTIEHK